MSKKEDVISSLSITNIPSISAIYFALLQSGYDYYSLGRIPKQIEKVNAFRNYNESSDFFAQAQQNTCLTYSFWPRAALLESAVFYIDADSVRFLDFEAYKSFVMSASNLRDAERDDDFWLWISAFPNELSKVINSESFKRYLTWENTWIEQQNKENAGALATVREIITTCVSKYDTAVNDVKIVLSPIKCAYSSDYHFVNKRFVFCSGQFRLESVIHEFLHHIVHPYVLKMKNSIVEIKKHFDGIDSSYYLDNDSGKINAFEEYLVRALTKDLISKTVPCDLDEYIRLLLSED